MDDILLRDTLNLERLAISLGKTKNEAYEIGLKKMDLFETSEDYKQLLHNLNKITLRRMILLSSLEGWNESSILDKKLRLWDVGIDVKAFPWFIDVLCSTWGSERVCDYFIIGQERMDKEWVKLVVNGKRVASFEAQLKYANDPSLTKALANLNLS